jgi:hypothetical protein
MKMPTLFPVLAVAFGLACHDDLPTRPVTSAPRPDVGVAGGSDCYTVHGLIHETGFFPNFAGTLSGDLEGTSNTELNFDVKFLRPTGHIPGQRTLVITGGAAPALIGRTIHMTLTAIVTGARRIDERAQIDVGAEGSLTSHGSLNVLTNPWRVELEYRGFICP